MLSILVIGNLLKYMPAKDYQNRSWFDKVTRRTRPDKIAPAWKQAWFSLWRRQPFVSGVINSSRLVLRVLYTFFCNISHILLANLEVTVTLSLAAITYAVFSTTSNSMVARVQWAFQVSQGSVETSFKWGGKRLFRNTKFHHDRPSFIGDIAKTFWSLFFWI